MLVMVVFFIAFRWIHLSTPLIRLFLFFFSCRRRHTISTRDWSSDVCSSDLIANTWLSSTQVFAISLIIISGTYSHTLAALMKQANPLSNPGLCMNPCLHLCSVTRWAFCTRSEERRVGKESRYRG